MQRHRDIYCPQFPVECDHCEEIVTRNVHDANHGEHCGWRPVQCKFCEKKMTIGDLADHLCRCDALNKRLLDRHQITCDTIGNVSLMYLLDSILRHPKKQYLIIEYLREKMIPEILVKLYYCFSNCEIFYHF
jgi:hypothetical protein